MNASESMLRGDSRLIPRRSSGRAILWLGWNGHRARRHRNMHIFRTLPFSRENGTFWTSAYIEVMVIFFHLSFRFLPHYLYLHKPSINPCIITTRVQPQLMIRHWISVEPPVFAVIPRTATTTATYTFIQWYNRVVLIYTGRSMSIHFMIHVLSCQARNPHRPLQLLPPPPIVDPAMCPS